MNDIFYVYVHFQPTTGDVVYVGKGCYGRAWDVTRNRNGHPEHLAWMKGLTSQGYLPSDWVKVIEKNLSESEAFFTEKDYLHRNGTTIFNRQSGERNNRAKLTDKQAQEIFVKRRQGVSRKALMDEYDCGGTAISNITTRRQWRAATACLI